MVTQEQFSRKSRLSTHSKLELTEWLEKLFEYEPNENLYDLTKKVLIFKNPTLYINNFKSLQSDYEIIKAIKFYLKHKYGVEIAASA